MNSTHRLVDSPLAQFSSWRTPTGRSPQAEYFRAFKTHDKVFFRSGNQIGKTTAGCVFAILSCEGLNPWLPERIKPPIELWISALSWDVLAVVLWPKLKEYLPSDVVISYRRRGSPEIPNQVTFPNGSVIVFRSAEQGREKYQGGTIDLVWVDEEHPEDVIEEIEARLLKRQGILTATLTPLKRSRWVTRMENAGAKVIRASQIEAAEAGIMDMGAVLKYAASLPERQRRVRVYGDIVALEGRVYPTLARETHGARPRNGGLWVGEKHLCPWPIPKGWRRFASADWGITNPTAVVVAVEDPFHGRLIIERVYYASGIRASVWATLIKEKVPQLAQSIISDHDAQARLELLAQGVPTSAARKEIDAGLEAVERFIDGVGDDGLPLLLGVIDDTITDKALGRCDAEVIFWEGEQYKYPSIKDGAKIDVKDTPVKKDDHSMDALRYLVYGYEGLRGGPPMPPSSKVKEEKDDDGYAPQWDGRFM